MWKLKATDPLATHLPNRVGQDLHAPATIAALDEEELRALLLHLGPRTPRHTWAGLVQVAATASAVQTDLARHEHLPSWTADQLYGQAEGRGAVGLLLALAGHPHASAGLLYAAARHDYTPLRTVAAAYVQDDILWFMLFADAACTVRAALTLNPHRPLLLRERVMSRAASSLADDVDALVRYFVQRESLRRAPGYTLTSPSLQDEAARAYARRCDLYWLVQVASGQAEAQQVLALLDQHSGAPIHPTALLVEQHIVAVTNASLNH